MSICPYRIGCSANNCANCAVLREFLRSRYRLYMDLLDLEKKDSDLENHFANGL